ncbi:MULTISPECIES: potassium-transporting ATPase subunit KdpC [unclassified Paenibacillus]|uniref:potassium-transporting ATPase subunit KdpC n=1 Tax=unclassified Paenibacillus TaxID=185978 RepID=UPI00095503FE|nr:MULTISPECIES: potassium-transporting ATPase subunit KdpC [unclassified Paenibacillus]ASS64970.1 potassium-transporting ATPase subunit KdpC [Paenibacillus sp. RUD330]SIQ53006.1 K+-transporting ATPase ATPase C chain [Paenibacillus sp. RU4X]SIQ75383.1 K+-transporting ATPase ATPase C chain [Paenibacillus sp. RU4T]
MKAFMTAFRLSALLLVLCGILYPLATTGAAQLLFPKQAEGSLIHVGSVPAGSELLAQETASPGRFQPRASMAKYDPTASSGSNRAVGTKEYVEETLAKASGWRKQNPDLAEVPADLVTASGSGFDPDLSPEAAKAQIPRISQASGIPAEDLTKLVDRLTKGRQLGLFGEPRVNVNALNLELSKRTP